MNKTLQMQKNLQNLYLQSCKPKLKGDWSMSLASFFESIPEKQRNLQLGLECDNPMSGAFPHKRVVHEVPVCYTHLTLPTIDTVKFMKGDDWPKKRHEAA